MDKVLPRFSLLSLVLATTIVALAVGLVVSVRNNMALDERNKQLAAKNKDYRNQLGIFEIEDPELIHAIEVPTEPDQPDKFRIYLPPGRKYYTYYKVNGIPQKGTPARENTEELPPGEHLFSVNLERDKDPATGEPLPVAEIRIELTTENNHSSTYISLSEEKNDWIMNTETKGMVFNTYRLSNDLSLVSPNEPLVLFRLRACEPNILSRDASGKPTSWSSTGLPGEVDGFMLWIESEPLPSP